MRWHIDWTDILPDIAKSWEVQDEGATFVFSLRKGMKWSDGAPITTEDVRREAEAAGSSSYGAYLREALDRVDG